MHSPRSARQQKIIDIFMRNGSEMSLKRLVALCATEGIRTTQKEAAEALSSDDPAMGLPTAMKTAPRKGEKTHA